MRRQYEENEQKRRVMFHLYGRKLMNDMEFKAKTAYKIIMGLVALLFIISPFYVFFTENIFENKILIIILSIISFPIYIIIGLDELYLIFRIIIIDEYIIKIKLFGRTIKESKIETLEFSDKRYGIRKITHGFGVK